MGGLLTERGDVPTYEYVSGHTYGLQDPRLPDSALLNASIQTRCRHFGRSTFLTMSLFNFLRIARLDAATGPTPCSSIRDQESTADSMRRNRFRFPPPPHKPHRGSRVGVVHHHHRP